MFGIQTRKGRIACHNQSEWNLRYIYPLSECGVENIHTANLENLQTIIVKNTLFWIKYECFLKWEKFTYFCEVLRLIFLRIWLKLYISGNQFVNIWWQSFRFSLTYCHLEIASLSRWRSYSACPTMVWFTPESLANSSWEVWMVWQRAFRRDSHLLSLPAGYKRNTSVGSLEIQHRKSAEGKKVATERDVLCFTLYCTPCWM